MPLQNPCRTPGCIRSRRGRDLLCGRCWANVPEVVRRDVLAHHRPGSIRQTAEYLAAVDEAIDAAKTALTANPSGA